VWRSQKAFDWLLHNDTRHYQKVIHIRKNISSELATSGGSRRMFGGSKQTAPQQNLGHVTQRPRAAWLPLCLGANA
jgi:hypothetical protein